MGLLVWLPVGLSTLAAAQDLRRREIADAFPLAIAAAAVVAIGCGWWPLGWLACLLGVVAGFLLSIPLFLLDGFGGGDVKLIAALGAWFGPVALLGVLFWMAALGGLLAVVATLRGKQDLAYGPAIALGAAVHSFWPAALVWWL